MWEQATNFGDPSFSRPTHGLEAQIPCIHSHSAESSWRVSVSFTEYSDRLETLLSLVTSSCIGGYHASFYKELSLGKHSLAWSQMS